LKLANNFFVGQAGINHNRADAAAAVIQKFTFLRPRRDLGSMFNNIFLSAMIFSSF